MMWTWETTAGTDVPPMVAMAQTHFEQEIDRIFTPDPVAYSRNLTLACVQQFYNPRSELLRVARCVETGRILAYTWAVRKQRTAWSDDEMISIKMAHVDLTLPTRQRLRLVTGMVVLWETWARECGVPIICSTTMRRDQDGFLKIHEKLGYDVRGSFAYKRLSTTQATPAVSLSPS